MLIVPIPEGTNWRRPPPVTVALIILNALIFFGYQSGDARRAGEATQAYFASSLPATELPAYQQYLANEHPEAAARMKQAPPELVFMRMEGDAEFMRGLRAGAVVTPTDKRYEKWREDRDRVDALEGRLSFRRFGFTPADPRPATLLTNQFLHGGLLHLVGNMVFLFILGVAVEVPLGGAWFLALYLAAGVAGNGLHWALNPASTVPLVGASGAISGLMGLFAVVFGLRPVRFFYWLIVVFGFRSLRGLAVLPVWIAWELVQYATNRASHVGYMAHAGGLMAGAAFGALVRHRLAAGRVERFHEQREGEAADRADYERARSLAQKADYAGANTVFARLAQRHPEDAEMMRQWHAIARRTPHSAHYLAACNAILALPIVDAARRRWQAEVFRDYAQAVGKGARLDAAVLARIARAFAAGGQVGEAQAAADMLFKAAPTDRHLPVIWDALAKAFAQSPNDPEREAQARRYRTLIVARARAKAGAP